MNRSSLSFLPSIGLALAIGSSTLQAAPVQVALKRVAEGLTQPLTFLQLPEGASLVVDQPGFLWLIQKDGTRRTEPVLDLTQKLSPINKGSFDERGFVDLALHPKFQSNHKVMISYTAPRRASAPADWDSTLRISEFTVSGGANPHVDTASEKVILEIDKPYSNHNSGRLAFGPDGFLYISVGDGGNANDQGKRPETGNGQNLKTHLGKVLRIDVNKTSKHGNYAIPSDNPFADGTQALPEIYAYGLRNIWGLSFDRGGTHELFAADVGQDLYEEVDIITKGGNYGWSLREGFAAFDPKNPKKSPAEIPKKGPRGGPLIDPILQYKHTGGPKKDPEAIGISITGGYIYRGKALPSLSGHYVFGDWSRNWGLPQGTLLAAQRPASSSGKWTFETLEVVAPEKFSGYITGFGQDNDGELYVLTNGSNALIPGKGQVWKLVPAGTK